MHLDRRLADRRIFPSVDIPRSGTRREELLLEEDTLRQVVLMRRMVAMISNDHSTEATERVLERMGKTRNNAEFLANLTKDL